MGLWSKATVVCCNPKVNVKKLLSQIELNYEYDETSFTYSYSKQDGLKIGISSTEILGDDFNTLLCKITKALRTNNVKHYIEVESTWYL